MFKGYTLSETLITLGIIGAIAAITIPSLIQNHQKKQTVVKLKQTYSIIAQALRIAENDLGIIENSSLSSKTFIDHYLKPYCKIIREFAPDEFPHDFHILCRTGEICDPYGAFKNAQKIILTNGTLIAPHPLSFQLNGEMYHGATIIVDINGLKRPNKYGKDVFMFSFDYKNGLKPYGLGFIASMENTQKLVSRDSLLKGSDLRACQNDGIYCAAVIMMDGWEICDDYPW